MMPPSLVMMPSGMPSALFHMASVAKVKARPSHPADDDQVQVAVLVDGRDGNGPAGPQAVLGGQDRGVVLEASRRVVAEQARAAFPHDDQIEPAVVVEVEERGVQTRDARERA